MMSDKISMIYILLAVIIIGIVFMWFFIMINGPDTGYGKIVLGDEMMISNPDCTDQVYLHSNNGVNHKLVMQHSTFEKIRGQDVLIIGKDIGDLRCNPINCDCEGYLNPKMIIPLPNIPFIKY